MATHLAIDDHDSVHDIPLCGRFRPAKYFINWLLWLAYRWIWSHLSQRIQCWVSSQGSKKLRKWLDPLLFVPRHCSLAVPDEQRLFLWAINVLIELNELADLWCSPIFTNGIDSTDKGKIWGILHKCRCLNRFRIYNRCGTCFFLEVWVNNHFPCKSLIGNGCQPIV